jgi:hypothetical protein
MTENLIEQPLEKQVILRQGELETERDPFDQLAKEATELGYPRRSDWMDNEGTGQKKPTAVYSDTAISALNIWADGYYGHHVSPAIVWFATQLPEKWLNEMDEVRAWLQECDESLYPAYRKSNFYESHILGAWLRDAGAIGTATMIPEEIIGEGICGFQVLHPRSVWLADDPYGRANLLHNKFKLTTRQIAAKFKDEIEKLSDPLQYDIKNQKNMTHRWEFIHAIYPANDQLTGNIDSGDDPFVSLYVQVDGEKLIRQEGQPLFPPILRLNKQDKPYGYGIIYDAIISINTDNEMEATQLEAAQKSVDPAMNIPHELQGREDLAPGGRNYYKDLGRDIKPIDQRINYPIGVDAQDRVKQRIKDHCHVDYFLMLMEAARNKTELTATQVMEMAGEKAIIMGPQMGTINAGLQQIHRHMFWMEYNAGRLPVAPAVVQDYSKGDITVNFVGPLPQAQKRLFKTQGITHGMAAIVPIVQAQMAAGQPNTVLDKIDMDKAADVLMESHGMPEKVMRKDEDVEVIRQGRAEQLRAEQAMEQASQVADAVPKVSKKVEEGSVLDAVTKGG